MTDWFADTYFFIALLGERGKDHERASRLARQMPGKLVTTYWVLTELGDAYAHTRQRLDFPRFVAALRENSQAVVVPPDLGLFDRGLALYAARGDKEWSLTDCISFTVMNDRGIGEAQTGDHHFEQAGYVALLK